MPSIAFRCPSPRKRRRRSTSRGIQTIADLQATVPGLRLSGREASGNVTVAIRGIRQQSATAATTGFYLDETSLQKRAAGGFGSQNGTPVPPLFDLERVEVLRGPQGTLFGGGSEGGTIRYIQPAPSLTDYSSYARAQWLTTKGGDPTYEAGVAFGGPIIQDTLGFRASLFKRNTGGYIDLTDYRTGQVYDENSNSGDLYMGRVALAWAPTERHEDHALLPEVQGSDGQPDELIQPVRAGTAARVAAVLQHSLHPLAAGSGPCVPGTARGAAGQSGLQREHRRLCRARVHGRPVQPQTLPVARAGVRRRRAPIWTSAASTSSGTSAKGCSSRAITSYTADLSTGSESPEFPVDVVRASAARLFIVTPGAADHRRADGLGLQPERHLRTQRPGPRRVDRDQHEQQAHRVLAGGAPGVVGEGARELRRGGVLRATRAPPSRSSRRRRTWASGSWPA